MPRYKIILEYDGTPYAGWQRQENAPSVQAAVEAAIFKFCSVSSPVTTAGRTDAGVHALAQTIHVDLSKDWPTSTVFNALNAHLRVAGDSISILQVKTVGDDFNARFSATKRHYLYRILNRRPPPALEAKRLWWVPRTLNIKAMQQAAQCLVGYHDFTTFRASHCQAKSPMRTLERLEVVMKGEEVHIHASARSFLHHQIRSFVGSLVEVGCGRWQVENMARALQARDRKFCGRMAPAHGLYLTQVDYPSALCQQYGTFKKKKAKSRA